MYITFLILILKMGVFEVNLKRPNVIEGGREGHLKEVISELMM